MRMSILNCSVESLRRPVPCCDIAIDLFGNKDLDCKVWWAVGETLINDLKDLLSIATFSWTMISMLPPEDESFLASFRSTLLEAKHFANKCTPRLTPLSNGMLDKSQTGYEYKPEILHTQTQDDIISKYQLPLSVNLRVANLPDRSTVSQPERRLEDDKQLALFEKTWLKRCVC